MIIFNLILDICKLKMFDFFFGKCYLCKFCDVLFMSCYFLFIVLMLNFNYVM